MYVDVDQFGVKSNRIVIHCGHLFAAGASHVERDTLCTKDWQQLQYDVLQQCGYRATPITHKTVGAASDVDQNFLARVTELRPDGATPAS
eukprot:COSAG02_NODE_1500_length_12266_cov_513.415468_4_plen_90_part_00